MNDETHPSGLIIGQYIDSFLPALDGVVLTVHNYARWLNSRGCACYVAAPEAPKDYIDREEYEIIRYRSIPLRVRPPYRTGIPLLDFEFEWQQHQMTPSLVHAHTPFAAGQEALRVARLRKIPLVATFHSKYYDDILEVTGSRILSDIAVRYIVEFYEKADEVWAVNEATAQTLRSYGYRGDIGLCENGTDFVIPADPATAREEINCRFGLEPDEKVVLFVGQHILQKNLPLLLDACAASLKTGCRFRLLMVGDGNARSQLEQQARELGIADRVIFAGAIRDRKVLSAIYLRAQVLAFPSVYDNAPLVLREAAAAGCPAILIAGSNASEGTADEDNAFWCEENSVSLAAALARALGDDVLRRRVGGRARQTLARPWQDILDEVYTRYLRIIANHRH